jgi:hypothetical protein
MDGRDGVPAPRGPLGVERETAGYGGLLEELETRIRTVQVRAALAVARELVLLYRQIGRDIVARQRESGWGSRVVARGRLTLGVPGDDRSLPHERALHASLRRGVL